MPNTTYEARRHLRLQLKFQKLRAVPGGSVIDLFRKRWSRYCEDCFRCLAKIGRLRRITLPAGAKPAAATGLPRNRADLFHEFVRDRRLVDPGSCDGRTKEMTGGRVAALPLPRSTNRDAANEKTPPDCLPIRFPAFMLATERPTIDQAWPR